MYTTHTYRYEKRGVVWLVIRLDAEWANRRIAKFVTSYYQPLAHWARGGSFERSFEAPFEKADVSLRVS